MSEAFPSLANHLLIAVPSLRDAQFSRSVTLLCQHTAAGAMGIVINQASEYTLGEVFRQMQIQSQDARLLERTVLAGGPVHLQRGFVVHDGAPCWEHSVQIAEGLVVSTSRDVLEAMARGQGPENVLVALGCAGWSAGQLEQELLENSWLSAPVDNEIIFTLPLAMRWQAAAQRIGVALMHMPDYAGNA